jgi:hypothetical protein
MIAGSAKQLEPTQEVVLERSAASACAARAQPEAEKIREGNLHARWPSLEDD